MSEAETIDLDRPAARNATTAAAETLVFHNHAAAQRMLLGLAVLTVLEAIPVHFLLYAWKPSVAWIVLGVTLSSLYWIIGSYRMLAARPHLLSAERLLLQVASLYTVEIERATITAAAPYLASAAQPGLVSLKFIVPPNVVIELSRAAHVHGPFGRSKTATRLAFYVERPAELLQQLCS